MLSLRGYTIIEELHAGNRSLVMRATRDIDGQAMILKVLGGVNPTPEEIARLDRESRLLAGLDLPGVVGVHGLFRASDHWVLAIEDFGGDSLARLGVAGELELGELLTLIARVTEIVGALHERSIIHKDLNPSNIVWARDRDVVKLIDFGIASRLSHETVAFDHPRLIEGTPAYLSPEQTGRTHQPLDHRTDLYSLGCTLYELLVGAPPFEREDLIELVHCHLALRPDSVLTRRPELPGQLAAIVDKLLTKGVDERYQSARGLQADLARCLAQWRESGRISSFELGAQDFSARLAPPAVLHGRDAEVAQIRSAFERACDGATVYVSVSGPPGIGKTSLVKALREPVTARRGSFVSGKFEQFRRDTPYEPILSALDALLGQLLMEPADRVAEWSDALRAAAGSMLPVLADFLPRLELLYEQLAPYPSLPVAELDLRFRHALVDCVRVLARAEHPLVIFIDDLQWADGASLAFLQLALVEEAVPYLLVIGAYRDEELVAAHPLRAVLEQLRSSSAERLELHLQALDEAGTRALVGGVLRRHFDPSGSAAALIHHKTHGNPLFVHTLLRTLVGEGIVSFDSEAGGWRWDHERLRVLEPSDNVVELVLSNMRRKLPSATRELLAQAACIGAEFELSLLAAVCGQSRHEVAAALMPALEGDYLIPTRGDYRLFEAGLEGLSQAATELRYKFAHDRIQQAVHAENAPQARSRIHLRIGRAMRARHAEGPVTSQILASASQLNRALGLVDDPAERLEIAVLNRDAGDRARQAVAPAAAREYYEAGLSWLGGAFGAPARDDHERAFARDHRLALELTQKAADAAYIDANYEAMDLHLDMVDRHACGALERVHTARVRINALSAQNEFTAAITISRGLLGELGVELPLEPTVEDVDAMLATVRRELGTRRIEELAEAGPMTDVQALGAMGLLVSTIPPARLALPALFDLVAAQMVRLTLRHGLAEESIQGLLCYGMALCARAQIELGYELGCLAELLVERRQLRSQMADLAVLGGCYIFHWKRPNRDSIEKMRAGYHAGLESGQVASACNSLQTSTLMALISGQPLEQIDREYHECADALRRHRQFPYLNWGYIYHQGVQNFLGLSDDPTRLQGHVYDEVEQLSVHERQGDLTSIYVVNFNKGILAYHFHRYEQALAHLRVLESLNQAGSMATPIANFYLCLALIGHCMTLAPGPDREQGLAQAQELTSTMARWASACVANYGHKHHLMAAELCRLTGRLADAREHYDLAIELAREHDYTQEEGLAFERAALHYLERGSPRLAGYYIRDAYYVYERWGARAKLEHLRHHYGFLLSGAPRSAAPHRTPTRPDARFSTGTHATLDLDSVLTATRAITRQTGIDELLQTIMRVSLEHAGAERGFLILVREEQLIIKAHGEFGETTRIEPLSLTLEDRPDLAQSVVQYVARTSEPVALEDASQSERFAPDPRFVGQACKSVLCVPIRSQGTLVAITYLENNRARAVFSADRVEILTLIMGQAAVSVENALLKQSEEVRALAYQVGGSLPCDAESYVVRRADRLLEEHMKNGELCYVFNARQMGKSSLRVRSAARLAEAGAACVSIDLSSIGSRNISAEQWYAGLARALVHGLGMQAELQLRRWWRDLDELSPVQRLDVLIDEEVLSRIDTPIAVLIDEVDSVLGLDFSLDDFFALLRSFYNRRAEDPRYRRLSVVLLGVASPADLIRDRRRTSFNVGRSLPLSGFRFDEARVLARGLAHIGNEERLLRAVIDWTCGQPFLTQKICNLISREESRPSPGREREWVAKLVRARVIDHWQQHDDPEHLGTIAARVLAAQAQDPTVLARYRQVLERGEVIADGSSVETSLILSGLVTRTFDRVEVGNPIYAAVFDLAWIDGVLAPRHTDPTLPGDRAS